MRRNPVATRNAGKQIETLMAGQRGKFSLKAFAALTLLNPVLPAAWQSHAAGAATPRLNAEVLTHECAVTTSQAEAGKFPWDRVRRILDHRGVDRVAASRRLSGSGWQAVSVLAVDEAPGAAGWRSTLAASALGAAGACLIFAVIYLVRRRRIDISGRRQAVQSDRRALEGHYGHLAKYVNDCVFLADDRMRLVETNDRATEIYGYSREEFLTLTVCDLRDASDVSRLTEHWDQAGQMGSLRFETVHRRKDGTAFPVEVSTRVLDADGRTYRQSIIRDVSEQKAMERQLQRALRELSAVIAASPAAIVSVTPEGHVKSWNAAAERLFGWTAEEAIGRPLPYVPPESRHESREILDRALRGEIITGLELERVAKDGTPLVLSLSIAPVPGPSGETEGTMAVLVDITREKQAERVLRESELRFRAAFEQAAVGMAHVAFDGSLLRVNQRLAGITGYPAGRLIDLKLADLVFEADRDLDRRSAEQLLAGELETYSVEKRLVRSDGSLGWVSLTMSILHGDNGEPLHWNAVVEGIDERRKAEEAWRESERKFRSLVENAPEGICILTRDEIRYANPTALALFGAANEQDLCANGVFSRFHPDYHDSIRKRLHDLETGEIPAAAEEVWVRMDGATFDVEVSAIPYVHEEEPGALLFIRDITARKHAERERRRLEEQFHQAQKMESVGRLAGGIAHDFNNHLTVINGYCALLLNRLTPDDPSRDIIEQVLQAGERSADLIRHLLSFSRKQIVEPRPTDLNAAIAGLHKMLGRLIGEDVRLVIDAGSGVGSVYMDPGQLTHILMNLAVNARDAMPSGGTLRIETSVVELDGAYAESHLETSPGTYVLLAVSDTGVGMTPETAARIFEPFFTTKDDTGGTGLGLSTVYGTVRQAGGTIWVYSEEGKGSTFKIYLPMSDAPPAPEADAPVPGFDISGGGETILVVEDQEELRRFAVEVLTKLGYRVLEAADGHAALALCDGWTEPIDLLLTDVIMPGLTGRVLAQRLRSAIQGLKVLYMSGYTANVIAERGVLETGLEYLAKPFTPDQLARKVRSVLNAGKPAPGILVVDDQDGVRSLLRETLTSAGFPVLEACDGRPALRILREHAGVQVVITDLVMPEQEGLETIRLIKKERPDIKVIAISGAFEGQFLRAASLFGADATMPKPVEAQKIVACVRRLLSPAVKHP